MRLNDVSAHFASMLEDFRYRRQIYRELSSLNDRELAELGFSRYDIADVAARSIPPGKAARTQRQAKLPANARAVSA